MTKDDLARLIGEQGDALTVEMKKDINKRLAEYANEKGKVDITHATAFVLTETKHWTGLLLYKVLSEVLPLED